MSSRGVVRAASRVATSDGAAYGAAVPQGRGASMADHPVGDTPMKASELEIPAPRRVTREELVVHSNEEHAHALALSEQIDFLGGIPAVEVADIHISPDSRVMLEQDLAGELDAISRYRERIAQAEML
jgi:hypothetical protein